MGHLQRDDARVPSGTRAPEHPRALRSCRGSHAARVHFVAWSSCVLFFSLTGASVAQSPSDPPSLLLIMDSSGSMKAPAGDGGTKIEAAKKALRQVVDELPDEARVGLRVYGHRVPNDDKQRGCKDSELISPVQALDRAELKSRIGSFDAKGFTPIGLSLREGAADLPAEGDRTIVLVSDGIDTCAPPPPCRVARDLSHRGIDLRVDTVGFDVNPRARKELRCIARVTGGAYRDADTASELAGSVVTVSVRAFRVYRASGTPITGGASSQAAPLVGPGQYVDVIAPERHLYYAVELDKGQTLRASATVVGRPRGPNSFFANLQIDALNPDGEAGLKGGINSFNGTSSSSVAMELTVGDDFGYDLAGRHTIDLSLEQAEALQGRRYRLEFVLDVLGGATASPSQSPDDEGVRASGPSDGPSDGFPWGGSLAFAAVGFVVGGLGAFALRTVIRS